MHFYSCHQKLLSSCQKLSRIRGLKLGKLTPKAKEYIQLNKTYSLSELQSKLVEIYNIQVSREAIRKYRLSLVSTPKVVRKVVKKTPKEKDGKGQKRFNLTYNGFIQLCENNPNHPFSQYFLKRNSPPKYPGRAELMKVLELLNDYYRG